MNLLAGILIFVCASLLGVVLTEWSFKLKGGFLIVLGSALGLFTTSWVGFLSCLAAHILGSRLPVSVGTVVTSMVVTGSAVFLSFVRRRRLADALKLTLRDGIVTVLALGFGMTLMFSTFQYAQRQNEFRISSLVLSDFASHIPLIRSFSMGENIPPKAPLFGGERIRYHFLFFFLAGFFERLGLPPDWAFNLPSAVGFAAFLFTIVRLTELLFPGPKASAIGWVTLLLTVTASSTAIFHGFHIPHSWIPRAWWAATFGRTAFLSGGPYYNNLDSDVTGLFWTLTIFTNQRHFAFGIALGLFAFTQWIGAVQNDRIKPQDRSFRCAVIGVLLGLLPFFHGLSFTAFMMVGAVVFFFLPHKRDSVVMFAIALIVAFPQLRFLSPARAAASPQWDPGYGLQMTRTVKHFLVFWLKNLGMKLPLIPLAVWLLPRFPRKIFLSSLVLFVIPNLVRFGPDVWTNHKFFNIWLIFLNAALAYALLWLWSRAKPLKALAVALGISISLTGLLDLAPIYNDHMVPIADWENDALSRFLVENTAPNEVLATAYVTYHPAHLVGRPVLLGWPYFSWSAGFNTVERTELTKEIFETQRPSRRCELLRNFGVRYLIAGRMQHFSEPFHPDLKLLGSQLTTAFNDDRVIVFDASKACGFNAR